MKILRFFFPILFLILPALSMAADEEMNSNPVLVTVNGVPITQEEVQHFITKQGKPIAPEDALRELINVELISQTAINENIMQEKSLELELKRIKSALIASTYLQKHLQNLEISEEDINARYKADYLESNESTEYNANHILVKTQSEAMDIIQQLDTGAEFTELAKKLSTGPSGKKGGELGWFSPSDMVAPFSKATTELSAGKYSKEPVQTQFGWHVIKLNETRKADAPTLASVRQQLTTSIAADSIKNILKVLHDGAKIEFNQHQ